jgi:anti-anti-sigma regulatory factor
VIETILESDSIVVCRPLGRLDWIGAVHLRDAVSSILRPAVHLAIDLKHVDSVDYDGTSAVSDCIALVQCVGGQAELRNVHEHLVPFLAVAGIDVRLPYEIEGEGRRAMTDSMKENR